MDKDKKKMIALGKGSNGGGGDAVWGSITGTLSDQTDLMTELNNKASTSSIPTKTSDLTNDSGFRGVIDINNLTQSELLDFYTNYTTRLTENTYVVGGFTFSTLTVTDPQAGTVLVLESNPQFKDQLAGASAGTIDVAVTITYIFANGTKQTTSGTYTVPRTSSLATVATSGSYSDLTNTPTIPAAQIQSDWNQSDTSALDFIKNKPTIPDAVSGVNDNTYWTSLTIGSTTKSIPAAQVQANWNESDTNSASYIQNKPTIPTVDVTAAGNNTFSGVNSFTGTTNMRSIDLELTNTGDTRTYSTGVYPNYVNVQYGGDSDLTTYTSELTPNCISVYDDDLNSTEIYNNYITVSDSGGNSLTISPSTFGTETLTFIDSNNVSTTVVVWTQPQI